MTHNWFDLCGGKCTSTVPMEPEASNSTPAVRLVERLQPGKVTASDLTIDAESLASARAPKNLGVDLSRLGITPAALQTPRKR